MAKNLKVKTVVMEPTLRLEDFLEADFSASPEEEFTINEFNKIFRQGGLIVHPSELLGNSSFISIHFSSVNRIEERLNKLIVGTTGKDYGFGFSSKPLITAAYKMLVAAIERYYRYPEPEITHQDSKIYRDGSIDYATTEA